MDANSFTDPYLLAYNEDETDSSYETNDLSISSPRLINININNKYIYNYLTNIFKKTTKYFVIIILFTRWCCYVFFSGTIVNHITHGEA